MNLMAYFNSSPVSKVVNILDLDTKKDMFIDRLIYRPHHSWF